MPTRPVIHLLHRYRKYEGRFLILFVLLVVTMMLVPLLKPGRIFPSIMFVIIPFAGVYASAYNRRALVVAVILSVPAVVLGVDQSLGESIGTAWSAISADWLAHISAAAFYGFTALTVLVYVLRQNKITADTVYGALSAYLLLGITWAFIYWSMENWTAGSIYLDPARNPDGMIDFAEIIYYSFVTLTTLGYGDILPVSSVARTAAWMEAVCGVLYTATLVASLVSRLDSQGSKEKTVSAPQSAADEPPV